MCVHPYNTYSIKYSFIIYLFVIRINADRVLRNIRYDR